MSNIMKERKIAMKKVSLMMLALLLVFSCFCIIGCEPKSNLNVEYLPDTTNKPIGNGNSDATVRIIRYDWDGRGTSYKDITGATAERILSLLAALPETNEKQKALSALPVFPEPGATCELPAERGTLWVEADGKIYRIDPELTEIALVNRHLGKGTMLDDAEVCLDEIGNALWYWPWDCWDGTYQGGKLTMEHKYAAETTVTVNMVRMNVTNDYHPENSMTVELISTVDQMVTVSVECQRSSDDQAGGEKKTVELVAGKPTTVDLSFGGFKNSNYDVIIFVDNTRVSLRVDPR